MTMEYLIPLELLDKTTRPHLLLPLHHILHGKEFTDKSKMKSKNNLIEGLSTRKTHLTKLLRKLTGRQNEGNITKVNLKKILALIKKIISQLQLTYGGIQIKRCVSLCTSPSVFFTISPEVKRKRGKREKKGKMGKRARVFRICLVPSFENYFLFSKTRKTMKTCSIPYVFYSE